MKQIERAVILGLAALFVLLGIASCTYLMIKNL